jgi:hypothetical protein
MAKHEVIERIMDRNISDGKWCGLGTGDERNFKLKRALCVLHECRARYHSLSVQQHVGKTSLLSQFPDIEVEYDYRFKVHYVDFNIQNREEVS